MLPPLGVGSGIILHWMFSATGHVVAVDADVMCSVHKLDVLLSYSHEKSQAGANMLWPAHAR